MFIQNTDVSVSKETSFKKLQYTRKECIVDYQIRSKNRKQFPGASALEFYSLIQIVIECLFQWDMNDHESKGKGIFGTTEAYGGAIEEQGRATFHINFLIWVLSLQQLLHKLFNNDGSVNEENRNKLKTYIKKIMIASHEVFDKE